MSQDQAERIAELERENAELRKVLQYVNSIGFSLTSKLCAVRVVAEKDDYDLIRRESVMDLVTTWRRQWDSRPASAPHQPDSEEKNG